MYVCVYVCTCVCARVCACVCVRVRVAISIITMHLFVVWNVFSLINASKTVSHYSGSEVCKPNYVTQKLFKTSCEARCLDPCISPCKAPMPTWFAAKYSLYIDLQ